MKHPWLAYVIVALLSIGAGVAIAGLPDGTSAAATIIPPTTTEAPATTTTTTTDAPATTTEAPAPTTTEPDDADSATDTTVPGDEATDTLPAELPDRDEIIAAAANGSNVAGAAARAVTLLTELGYVGVLPLNGSDIVEFTTIYYAPGLEEAAARMADDLDLLPEFVAPLADLPAVTDLPADVELVAYIGRDRA
jgi:hypothetical protein